MNKQTIKEEGEEIKQAVKQVTDEFKKEVVDEQDDGVIAAIGYIWILFLIPMFLKKESEFCQHHAKQGLVLFVFSIIIAILGSIPVFGWFIIAPIGAVITIVLMLLGIVNALRNSMWEMPYLGKYAKKLNF